MATQILASRGRSLGNKYCSSLPKLVATRIGSSCHFSTTSEPQRRRHPQSFVSPDIDLELGELETELPPGHHQNLDRRDRGPMKPRHANDGKDSYWRPPWKNPRAEITSADDFANRPRVSFGEGFETMHDAMAVLSWMGQDEKDGMYKLYLNMMTSLSAGQKKKQDPKNANWGVLSTNTSHEYVVRVVAQEYNVTTSRAAGVIQLQHNEEQLKKDPDFKVNHSLQAHVDMKVRENIREVYKSYGEKDPLQFVEDPVASTGTVMKSDAGSPIYVKAPELTDMDALMKKTRMKEIQDAKVRIANHIYVEDVDERSRKVKYDQEVARLLKMRKQMGGFYADAAEGHGEEEIQPSVNEDGEEVEKIDLDDSAEGFGGGIKMMGRTPKRWVGKRINSVFVHNLRYEVVSQDLKDHMSTVGEVINAEVLTMPNGRSLGWGTVTYATSEAAKEAIEKLHDTDLKGRKIGVDKPKGFDDDFDDNVEEEAEVKQAPLKRWTGIEKNSVSVRNLPFEVVPQELIDYMSTAGDVVNAEIVTSKRGWALGLGNVEFATPEGAKEAIKKLNNTDLKGRTIRVKEYKGIEGKKAKKDKVPKSPPKPPTKWEGKRENSVFVHSLPIEVVTEDLKDHMCTVGDIVKAEVIASKSGRSLRYGFVEFATPEGAAEAIEKLNNSDLKGKLIGVRVAEVAEEPPKTWGRSLWKDRLKNLPETAPKTNKSNKQSQTKASQNLEIPVGASPYPENNRGHKEDPGTRRPRWKYTAQVVNTYMQENPAGSKRHGKAVAALAKGRRHGRVIDGNTIIEQDGALRVASVAELEKTSWKHVRNESEFIFRGVKEAWLKRELEGEVGGWGIQEEVNKPEEPIAVEGKTDDDAEGEGEEGSVDDKEGSTDDKE